MKSSASSADIRAAPIDSLLSIASELTAPRLLRLRAAESPGHVAIREGRTSGRWIDWTWHAIAESAAAFGSGLLASGARRGDHIGMVCEPRIEAIIAFLGSQGIGCVPFAIHPSTPPAVCGEIFSSARPVFIVTDNASLVRESLAHAGLPELPGVCTLGARESRPDGEPQLGGFQGNWQAILELGEERRLRSPSEYACAVDATGADDVAAIYYTSGTTGAPKGVLLTWKGLALSLCGFFGAGSLERPPAIGDRTLHETTMATPTGFWFGILYPLVYGSTAFIPPYPPEPEILRRAVQPTVYYGRPAVWVTTAGKIDLEARQASIIPRLGYRLLMTVGGYHLDRLGARKTVLPGVGLIQRLLGAIFVRQAKRAVGFASLRYALTGGAPLSASVVRQWFCWGVTIRSLYGMTECSGVATIVNDPIPRPDTVGKPARFADVRLSDEGEILIGGPIVFKGYLDRPGLTAEVIDEHGFFHTGDLGSLREDGSLVMLDRKNNVIRLLSGDAVTSAQLESGLTAIPLVAFAMVVGNDRAYACALIEINPEQVRQRLSRTDVSSLTYADLAAHEAVLALVGAEVRRVNETLASEGNVTVERFRLLPHPLDRRDPQLVTATGKIRRANVIERYAVLIEEMYSQGGRPGDCAGSKHVHSITGKQKERSLK